MKVTVTFVQIGNTAHNVRGLNSDGKMAVEVTQGVLELGSEHQATLLIEGAERPLSFKVKVAQVDREVTWVQTQKWADKVLPYIMANQEYRPFLGMIRKEPEKVVHPPPRLAPVVPTPLEDPDDGQKTKAYDEDSVGPTRIRSKSATLVEPRRKSGDEQRDVSAVTTPEQQPKPKKEVGRKTLLILIFLALLLALLLFGIVRMLGWFGNSNQPKATSRVESISTGEKTFSYELKAGDEKVLELSDENRRAVGEGLANVKVKCNKEAMTKDGLESALHLNVDLMNCKLVREDLTVLRPALALAKKSTDKAYLEIVQAAYDERIAAEKEVCPKRATANKAQPARREEARPVVRERREMRPDEQEMVTQAAEACRGSDEGSRQLCCEEQILGDSYEETGVTLGQTLQIDKCVAKVTSWTKEGGGQ